MSSIYDEVDREARADRRNADIPRDRPDLTPEDRSPLNPAQFTYEPPRPEFLYDDSDVPF